MFRWKLLATRLIILILLGAAMWISRDALIKKWITRIAENELGAKVEIGRIHADFAEQKLFFKQLTFADPRDSMSNLFQADSAVVKLDWNFLSQRKFVIEEGSTSQLVFGSPRTKPGILEYSENPTSKPQPDEDITIELINGNSREVWLDHFKFSNPSISLENLKLTTESQRVFTELDQNIEQYFSQIKELKSTIEDINGVIQKYDNNVLRTEGLEIAKQRVSAVGNEIDLIARQLAQLDLQIASNVSLLKNAKSSDEKLLARSRSDNRLDGKTLSELLLSREQLKHAKEVLYWFITFKNAIPDSGFGTQQSNANESFDFVRGSSTPDFFIKKLNLDGEGRVAGQKFNFTGELENFSLDPIRQADPTTILLRAQGNTHVVVECLIDRRNQNRPFDEIQVICSDMPLPSRILGSKENLQLSVSPCRSKTKIRLQSDCGNLSGQFKFDYENLVTQIDHLDSIAGGKSTADRINLELGSINSYSVTATVGGTLQNPTIEFTSDLGTQLANKFNHIASSESRIAQQNLNNMFDQQKQRLLTEFADKVRSASEQLHDQIGRRHETLAADLESQMSGAIRR